MPLRASLPRRACAAAAVLGALASAGVATPDPAAAVGAYATVDLGWVRQTVLIGAQPAGNTNGHPTTLATWRLYAADNHLVAQYVTNGDPPGLSFDTRSVANGRYVFSVDSQDDLGAHSVANIWLSVDNSSPAIALRDPGVLHGCRRASSRPPRATAAPGS